MIINAKESQPFPSGEFTVHRSTIKLKRRELVFMGGSLTCWELGGTNNDGDYGGDDGDHNYDGGANYDYDQDYECQVYLVFMGGGFDLLGTWGCKFISEVLTLKPKYPCSNVYGLVGWVMFYLKEKLCTNTDVHL